AEPPAEPSAKERLPSSSPSRAPSSSGRVLAPAELDALRRSREESARRRVEELARLADRLVDAAKQDDPPALRIAQQLALGLGHPVRLTITDNRRMMVSARRGEGVIEVRLHRMFLDADDALVETLARYLGKRDRAAGELVDAFIASRAHQITKPRQRRTIIRTRGAHHDLKAIYESLLPRFVESFDDVRITWGRLTRAKRGQRGLQLGTYTPSEKLVRIHPVLDQAWVPEYVVATVVHHEMLHHALPAVEQHGKTYFHTPEFRRRERAYPDHDRTERWERANLAMLLRSMRR
ncbi:MAG: hypothetical protein KC586_27355, partial [Myxococcales bacterium]|nr:hypothetical protein [Myxococcales bacterium]